MEENKRHTYHGTLSLIFGAFGLFSYFLLGLFFGMPLAVLAVIIGFSERKIDNFANYGFILGIMTIIIAIVMFITAIVLKETIG